MSKNKRKQYSSQFEAKVALEAVKREKTIAEDCDWLNQRSLVDRLALRVQQSSLNRPEKVNSSDFTDYVCKPQKLDKEKPDLYQNKTPLANRLGVLCVVEIEPPETAKSIN